MKERKIVVVNQAVNYLTIGFCNAFRDKFDTVALITGSIHTQGEELHNDIHVTWINKWYERPARKKAMSYLQACIRIWWLLLTKYRGYEVFFVSVPPMAYLLNIVLPNRFSMVIWDVFPDGFKITGMKESHPVYWIWARLNRWSFRKAYRLFTIGEKMADLVAQYVSREKIIIQPIWSIFQENEKCPKHKNPFVKAHDLGGKFVVQYSGNIGLTHKVELMVQLADRMQRHEDIVFMIIGRGPRKPALKQMVEKKGLPNCMFLPFQSDDMFPYSLSAADLGVVILDAVTAKGSVPSKSYNLMSYGIPSLYIASDDSQLKVYADQFGHAGCFEEGNLEAAAEFIVQLKDNPDVYARYADNAVEASKHFRRDNADKFVEKYLNNG